MSRPLFPFTLLGYNPGETVGDTMSEAQEQTSPPITVNPQVRDFRPVNRIKDRVPPAPGAKKDDSEADPKASSATVVAGSSPSESPTSPPVIEERSADVVKESSQQDDGATEVNSSLIGIVTPPVLEYIPDSPASQTSSSPLL
jgi:hypothetical protein